MDQLEKLPPRLFKATPKEDGFLLTEEISFEEIPKPNQQGNDVLKKAAVDSKKNLHFYGKTFSPFVKAFSPWTKDLLFHFHPYCLQRYPFLFSEVNPFFGLIKFWANTVRQNRNPISGESSNLFSQLFYWTTANTSRTLKIIHDIKVSGTRESVCTKYA